MGYITKDVRSFEPMKDSGAVGEPIFGFKGQVYRIADLPKSDPATRWVASRKLLVAAAVVAETLPAEEAKQRYQMLDSELKLWCRAVQESNPKLLNTSQAYNVTNGVGWEFPECKLVLVGNVVLAGYNFRTVSFSKKRECLIYMRGNTNVELTTLESDVFRVLAHYQGTVVPSEMLMHYRHFRRPHLRSVNRKLIDVIVCKLRTKLGVTLLHQQVVSVWGRGYMFLKTEDSLTQS